MKLSVAEFAGRVGCMPEDIRFLIASKRLIVRGQRIDADLDWLAVSKLKSIGWMDEQGRMVPLEHRPRARRAKLKLPDPQTS